MTVHLGRGAIIVDCPSQELKDGLRRFVHRSTGGEYENLYTLSTLSNGSSVLVTLPGYANRVKGLCSKAKIVDERIKMPAPSIDESLVGMEPWHDSIVKAICACGGVISVPDIIGFSNTAASIIRAFPRNKLLERGTALSVVAVDLAGYAREVADALEKMLPEREVGLLAGGRCSDSEDVIVSAYDAMKDVQIQYAGVFIGEVPSSNVSKRAMQISSVRSAARWGISSTSFGGIVDIGMDVEGLFGPLVSYVSYNDVVASGIGVPITVVWIPSPKPRCYSGSAPISVLSDMAMRSNKEFINLVSEIINHVSNDVGCIACTDDNVTADRISAILPNVVKISGLSPAKERKAVLDDIAGGTIRKAIVSSGCFPRSISHGVMVVANCEGEYIDGWNIPWRHLTRPGEKTYLVDFRHDWDSHNGRPGRLSLNDEARMRKYREMGFSQMSVSNAAQLPF